jgi:hypothetical protein
VAQDLEVTIKVGWTKTIHKGDICTKLTLPDMKKKGSTGFRSGTQRNISLNY